MDSTFRIRRLAPPEARAAAPALAEVLADCVAGGASVSFMADMTVEDAFAFWRGEAAAGDGRAILVAEDDQGLFGVVQLVPCWPPNQPHRADVSKLLVHRRGRGRGAAKALMLALEAEARVMGKRLLVLDTIAGGAAERLYAGLGWTRGGEIPDFALMPDGTPAGTSIFYKQLAP